MPPRPSQQQLFTVEKTLGAADTTKELVAAPGVGRFIAVVTLQGTVLVSAAQAVDIESSDGAVELVKLPATPGLVGFSRMWVAGFKLPENTSLRMQPAAAGPSAHCSVEYYIEGKQ